MGLIFLLSAQGSLPQAPDDLLDTVLKKLGHLTEYAVLGILLYRALAPRGVTAGVLLCTLVCAGYAATDEFHQSLVPGRGPSAADALIDTLGGAAGAWLFGMRRAAMARRMHLRTMSRGN